MEAREDIMNTMKKFLVMLLVMLLAVQMPVVVFANTLDVVWDQHDQDIPFQGTTPNTWQAYSATLFHVQQVGQNELLSYLENHSDTSNGGNNFAGDFKRSESDELTSAGNWPIGNHRGILSHGATDDGGFDSQGVGFG